MHIRRARRSDLLDIVRLLRDDSLAVTRETLEEEAPENYFRAFEDIDRDPQQFLAVGETDNHRIISTLQLTYIPNLTHQGALRAHIEAVRVQKELRGQGIGHSMITWAIEQAKERGCRLVQLTSDRQRPQAHRFYKKLGFSASHIGFKLKISCFT